MNDRTFMSGFKVLVGVTQNPKPLLLGKLTLPLFTTYLCQNVTYIYLRNLIIHLHSDLGIIPSCLCHRIQQSKHHSFV